MLHEEFPVTYNDSTSAPAKPQQQIFWVFHNFVGEKGVCTCVMGEQTTEFSKWNKLGLRLFFQVPKLKLR